VFEINIHLVIYRVELSEICFFLRYCRLAVVDYGFTCLCFTTYYSEAPSGFILTPIYKVDMHMDGHVSSQGDLCSGSADGMARNRNR
jgi:hypothetical protein